MISHSKNDGEIPSPFFPQPMVDMRMDVIVKKTPIPKMIGWLANYMLILVGVGVFYVKGFR